LGGLSFEPVTASEPIPMAAPTQAPVAEDATAVPDLDFDVDLPDTIAPEPRLEAEPVVEPVPEFEPQFAPLAEAPAPVEEQQEPKPDEAFDLAFDMDFDTAAPSAAPVAEAVDEHEDKHDDPLALDLSLDGPASDIDMADLAGEFDLPDLPKVEPEQSVPADELKDPLFDLDVMDFSLPQGGAAAEPQAEAAQETEALDDPFALPELAATPAPAPAMPAFDLSDIDLDLPEPATAELPLPEVEIEMEGVGAGAGDLSPAHMEMETKLDLALAYQEIGDKEGARELLDEVIKGGNSEQVSKAAAMREKLA
jgi:pilus assembly protein FimV